MISPGYVGVVIDMLGDSQSAKELHVGMHCIAPWKSVYQFPIFEQNDTWEGEREGFNFQTSEGMAVSSDIGITFHLRPDSIPDIFQRYLLLYKQRTVHCTVHQLMRSSGR